MPYNTHKMNNTPNIQKLTVWQQNLNKSAIAQHNMLQTVDPAKYDIIAMQEPAMDRLGRTFVGLKWRAIYPAKHATIPKDTRAIILINKNIQTDSYLEINMETQDAVGLTIQTGCGEVEVYNVYLDSGHSRMLRKMEEAMRSGRGQREGQGRAEGDESNGTLHWICLGDFNCHHPMWDDIKNTHLFTCQNMDAAQILLDFLAGQEMFMALPGSLPTLEATTTKNLTRPDNVFCTPELLEAMSVCNVQMEYRPAATDHFPIKTVFNTTLHQITERIRYNFREVDWAEFNKSLKQELEGVWGAGEIRSEAELEERVEAISNGILATIDRKVSKARPSPYSKRWWTKELKKEKALTNKLGKLSWKNRADQAHPIHLKYR